MDIFSRKIVGWEIFERECAEDASSLFHQAHLRKGYKRQGVDPALRERCPDEGRNYARDAPAPRGVASFSRPSVSNDNAFSEARFKTLKYPIEFLSKPFESLQAARQWLHSFVNWYNEVHRQSALTFITPAQRHRGENEEILHQRKRLYAACV